LWQAAWTAFDAGMWSHASRLLPEISVEDAPREAVKPCAVLGRKLRIPGFGERF